MQTVVSISNTYHYQPVTELKTQQEVKMVAGIVGFNTF